MCGICGFNWANKEKVREMMEVMKHRGPDDEGVYVDESVSMGHKRLSIIDLSPQGHQPMTDSTGRYSIVYNGEIYNFPELRESLKEKGYEFRSNTDTEVLLYLFIQHKEKSLDMLNGMFAFCVYDKKEKKLFLARDRFGIKPLYYLFDGKRFMFSSEIPAILVHKIPTKPNKKLIRDFLLYNITDHTDETFFVGINKFPKGHWAFFNLTTKKLDLRRWWVNDYSKKRKVDYCTAVNEFKELLRDSVNMRLISDVHVGTCLSGGLDSSSIACLINDSKKSEITTFSAVFPDFEKDESKYIDLVCKATGMENNKTQPTAETILWDMFEFVEAHGEPVPGPSPYSSYCVFKLAKDHDVTVLLNGQGADELLGGYHYFYGFYLKGLLKNLKLKLFFREFFHLLKNKEARVGLASFFYLLLPKRMQHYFFVSKSNINRKLLDVSETEFFKKYYSCSGLDEALKFHMDHKLEHLLTWEDRNSMAHSREARVPFLDYRLVRLIQQLPEQYIIRSGSTKSVLRSAVSNIVPMDILNRRDKIGFATPEDEWLRERHMRDLLYLFFFDDKPLCSDYIDVKKTREMIEKHMTKKANMGRTLWKTLFLEVWFRLFFDRRNVVRI